MIWLAIMTLSGASLGIYQALAMVPKVRTLPFIGQALIIAGLIVWPNIPPNDVIAPAWLNFAGVAAFVITMASASTLYSAKLWMDYFPEAGLTYREFAWRDFTGSFYIRQQYAAMLADREELRATWDYDGRGAIRPANDEASTNEP
ncbi:hypothetical protein I6E81_08905 [Salinibacterium sp. NG22]|uniref:hypothetical protein n=1 Tax=Salinibacterium sp. NG22 TaxID=2792040 RepID=UPI0018CEAB64|nr:hypothetical protein [Salinibacterium sp. NG22]MBH0110284.1 hypothetical protein [Salinibacterium sp. NG22]